MNLRPFSRAADVKGVWVCYLPFPGFCMVDALGPSSAQLVCCVDYAGLASTPMGYYAATGQQLAIRRRDTNQGYSLRPLQSLYVKCVLS